MGGKVAGDKGGVAGGMGAGAAVGGAVGGPIGAVTGAVVGGLSSVVTGGKEGGDRLSPEEIERRTPRVQAQEDRLRQIAGPENVRYTGLGLATDPSMR